MTLPPHVLRILPAGLACLAVAAVLAQFRYNNQVNNEVYGHGPTGSIRYAGMYTSTPMPSEQRHAAWKSGLLPSELRMNAKAAGPLSPATPTYVNPAYRPATAHPWGNPYATGPASPYGSSMGSVHNAPSLTMTPATINPPLTSRAVFGR